MNGASVSLDRINSCNADGVFASSASVNVQAGGALTVGRGVRFKFTGNGFIDVSGHADLRGSGHDPIVVTTISRQAVRVST